MDDRITDRDLNSCEKSIKSNLILNSEKPGKRPYKQIYRKDWENNPIFKGWLSPVSYDKHKAECTACSKELLAHRLTLLKHASSAKHLKKVSMANDTDSSDKLNQKENETNNDKSNENHAKNDEDTVDILPQLVTFPDANVRIDDESLNNIDKVFGEEMEAQLSQFTSAGVETNEVSLGTTNDGTVSDNINLIIHSESFVDIADSSQAINFKQGYVAKNQIEKNNSLLCTSAFLNDKMDETRNGIINKLTTFSLQISTRVTDYSRGISVSNLAITLYKLAGGKWMCVGESVTDELGRGNLFPKTDSFFSVGCYKLHYDVATYYEMQNLKSYFPFIEISFLIRSPHETHHIPLMISPNGYTAYRSFDY